MLYPIPDESYSIRYLAQLHSYLLSFTKRTQPLVDVDALQTEASEEFEKLWEQGQISSWGEDASKPPESIEGIWCAACTPPIPSHSAISVFKPRLTCRSEVIFKTNGL